MKKTLLLICAMFFLFAGNLFSQDSELYKDVITDLSQKKFYGRGYYKSGDKKAAKYIKKQFVALGAQEYNDLFQEFSFPVNVYHKSMEMSIDGVEQIPGIDFVMREFSIGNKGEFGVYYLDTINFDMQNLLKDLEKEENKNSLVVIDLNFMHSHGKELGALYKMKIPGIILKWHDDLKFYKAYSSFTVPTTILWVSKDFPMDAKTVSVNIKNKMIDDHKTSNVISYIEGKEVADTFFVFSAHYDHLGVMGKKLFFPGANDNASGVAMLMSLAEHYAKSENQPKYSMLFIATAGEETGLRGAQHYVENPYFPINQIKFEINVDMIADNSKDIYIEISENGQDGLDLFNKINSDNSYFTALDQGELSGNSDHFPFAEAGVPSIFFMMKGDAFKVYHTPKDNTDNIYLDNFPKLFKLITEFVETY